MSQSERDKYNIIVIRGLYFINIIDKVGAFVLFQVAVSYSTEMNSIDIAAAVENGRPRAASEETRYQRRLRNLQELWMNYSFQIVVVVIAVILLIYTIVGKCNCAEIHSKKVDDRTS